MKSKIVFEDTNMIQTQIESNGNKSVHERIFTDDKLTVVRLFVFSYRNFRNILEKYTGLAEVFISG